METLKKLFRRQNCLRRKSSLSWKYSKTFSPAKLPQLQIINILKLFKDFFACKIVFDANHHYPETIQRFFACKIALAANHHYPEKIQRLFRLQNCLSRKSAFLLNIFKDLFACKIVLAENHHYPGNIQNFFACKIVLDANHHYPKKFQRLFSPAKLS